MPKLLQITAAYNCGAPGRIVEQIGVLAQNNGWEVYAVHGSRHSNPSQLITLCQVTVCQERKHALRSYFLDGHGLGSRQYTEHVVEKIKELNPDVIHIHNLHGYYINYDILFSYPHEAKKPIVWTLHDFWAITGHCVHFDYNGCEKWKTECSGCGFHKDYPFSFIDKSNRNYHLKKRLFTGLENVTLVPVSKWVGDNMRDSFLKEYSIKVIYNGVDMSVFYPRKSDVRERLGLQNKYILLGVASPWSNMKGLDDYFKLNEVLSSEYVIVLVGLTPKQIKNLPIGILGIQRTNNVEELAEYYSMADVVLNLSYQETFGMTTVEGMACGTPGIVYNKTASPELVDQKTGVVLEAGNIDALKKMIMAFKEQDFKKVHSSDCISRVKKFFDKDKCFGQYINLYNNLLGGDCPKSN